MVGGEREAVLDQRPGKGAGDCGGGRGDGEGGDGYGAHVQFCAREEDSGAGDGGDAVGEEKPSDEEEDDLAQLEGNFEGLEERRPGEEEVCEGGTAAVGMLSQGAGNGWTWTRAQPERGRDCESKPPCADEEEDYAEWEGC